MELETFYWHGLKTNMVSDNQSNIDIALLIKCALEAGATIIRNDAGKSAGIYVKGKPFDINDLFKNCQDE